MNRFLDQLQSEFKTLIDHEQGTLSDKDTIKIDLHCHDRNSDVPDELWGRILRVPETYLSTADLVKCTRDYGVDLVTVTNHNNARSCFELLSKGMDVLVGAEFTCRFPEMAIQVHVLTYGFTPQQETQLDRLRGNIYKFLAYAAEHDLPTVLAHPLFMHVEGNTAPPMEYMEKIALLFERFEVVNGQRDVWQNLLTGRWVRGLNEEKLSTFSKKHAINPYEFCRSPWRKAMTGGSDDHMGMFAGLCGTIVQVDTLKRGSVPLSALVLKALRDGQTAPYGQVLANERMNAAFLSYFCQLCLNIEDPGLLRMFLHQGEISDKLLCLAIGNAIQEMKRHRYTSRFLKLFHNALHGVKPSLVTQWAISKDYQPIVEKLADVAKVKRQNPAALIHALNEFIPFAFHHLSKLIVSRLADKVGAILLKAGDLPVSFNAVIGKLEVPSHLRNLLAPDRTPDRSAKNMTHVNILQIFDQLSFPMLFSSIIAASNLMSTRVLYNHRKFLDQVAGEMNFARHPQRALWITDTLMDQNGVSHALQSTLREVQKRQLPVDFLVCSNTIEPMPHLLVVPSLAEFNLLGFNQQKFNMPDLTQLHRLFYAGNYDRIICSTEFLMGPVALYLKEAFHVPAYFYMHTDWMEFFNKNSDLNEHNLDRVRRLLRAFYRTFDGIFALNDDHVQWLSSPAMGIDTGRIFKTAHWADSHFKPVVVNKTAVLPGVAMEDRILLYTGRLGEEKGVMELPAIYAKLKSIHPELKIVIAGTGPCEQALRQALPDGIFLGWVTPTELVNVYAAADLLLLPSRFDTFGLVVLEALSCGLPVAVYNVKGPKDLVSDGVNGVTADTQGELIEKVAAYFSCSTRIATKRAAAQSSAAHYNPIAIVDRLLANIGLPVTAVVVAKTVGCHATAEQAAGGAPHLPKHADSRGKAPPKAINLPIIP